MDDDSDSVFNEVGDDATVVAAGVVETRVQREHSTEDGVLVGGGDQRLVSLLVVFLVEVEMERREKRRGGGRGGNGEGEKKRREMVDGSIGGGEGDGAGLEKVEGGSWK